MNSNGTEIGDYRSQAKQILRQVPLIDGHNDWPYIVRGWHLHDRHTADLDTMSCAHTDLNRLREGCVGGQIWSAYVPSPDSNKRNNFESKEHYQCMLETLQQIDLIHHAIERYPSKLGLATSASQIWDVFRSGRVASLIGVEGLHQIANSASVLRNYHRLGVRYITLTHSQNNLYADSATSETPFHGGLSSAGVDIVKEMNRIGMIVDLSHTSSQTQEQVLALSTAPVIYSHSSCAGLCQHVRNVSDECLQALKRNRGIIMISFLPSLTSSTAPARVQEVADHIIYAGERIGFEHVGIGSDFDGVMHTVSSLDNVSMFPALVEELLRRNVSESAVKGVLGLNFIRILEQVEAVARLSARCSEHQVLSDEVQPIFDDTTRDEMIRVRSNRQTGI